MSFAARILLCIAGLSLLCATIAGAAASHALVLDERGLRAFGSAVDFQFFHGLGIIGVALVAERARLRAPLLIAAWLFVAGTVLFCGSLYATSLGAASGLTALAPVGGIAFMAGWLLFAFAAIGANRGAS